MSASNVLQMAPPANKPNNNGGNGSNGGGSIEYRLTRLETRMEYVATKEDLKDIQITLIKWVVGVAIASSTLMGTLIVAVLRILS